MSSASSQISFYSDLMVMEVLAAAPKMHKTAGLITDMVSKIKDYVGSHVNPSDKLGSLLKILGPGAITMTFRALGMPWIGMLAGLAMSYFGINLGSIIETIWDGLKSLLHGDKPTTSGQVDSVVQGAIQQHAGGDTSQARTANQAMRDARMVKLAMIDYEKQIFSLTKEAAPKGILSTKGGVVSVLGKVLSVLFKVSLWSAGLMVGGDIIHGILDRATTPSQGTPAAGSHSKQTKFVINPSYSDQTHSGAWGVSVSNDPSSIENMLVTFAKEVYTGLDGKEGAMSASSNFQKILSDIIWYNHASAGDRVVIIPKEFKSKKDIVDYFIDDVAKSSP